MLSNVELEVGQKVTILEWNAREIQSGGMFSTSTRIVRDRSWVGDAMTIRAISLPFIVVDALSYNKPTRRTLDTRELVLMELSDEFLAIKNGKPVCTFCGYDGN